MKNIAAYLEPGSHLLAETDFTPTEWNKLIELSEILKQQKKSGEEEQYLRGKNIALIFGKTSTRTRCAFEVAAADQGAFTTYLDPVSSQMGHKESVSDTARVLGRYYDGIEYRGDSQHDLETLAEQSGVPVWNGLTEMWHPTQMLADSLTMKENAGGKPLNEISYAYIGDARYNMGRSLLVNGALLGATVTIIAPKALWPAQDAQDEARRIAAETGATITLTEDVSAVEGVDFVHTDIWVSMGEPAEVWDERIELLRPYRVDEALMDLAGPNAKFMHCLPAYHNLETGVGREVYDRYGLDGVEVSDEVFNSDRSIVFDQAENRLHTIKAVMVRSLGQNA